jgi:hypothetical protein
MGTNAIHFIIDPFTFAAQFAFYPEGREFIGDDTKGPTRSVRRGSIVSKGNDLWRGSVFIAFTEGAESTDGSSFLWCKIRGPSTPLCGDNHPSSMNGIFSQFRHRRFFSRRKSVRLRGETSFNLCPSLPLQSLLILSFGFAFDA